MNVLTDSDVYVKNELFATLDSTTKKLELNVNKPSVISDTVGFIQKLPHELVASFRSTLSDIQGSDLILKVVDSSYSNIDMHIKTIDDTIKSIECDKIEALFVFNKIDLISTERLKVLMKRFPGSIFTSAFKKIGHENLISNISDVVSIDFIDRTIKIKYSDLSMIDYIYKNLDVYVRRDTNKYVEISAKGPKSIFKKIDGLIKT